MTTLIIDNYDSFTGNLLQTFGALGAEPRVVRNDAIDIAGIKALRPSHVVLSPGPGRPDDRRRIGVSADVLGELDVPILGVCLGHQAIVCAEGGRVVRGEPVHGKVSPIHHDGAGLFRGLPSPFSAMRYHSLVAERSSLPSTLVVSAWCKDGTIMAVRHRRRPIFGLQFHPESIGTPVGAGLCSRFLRGDYG